MNMVRKLASCFICLAVVGVTGVAQATFFSENIVSDSLTSSGHYSGQYGTSGPDLIIDGRMDTGWLASTKYSATAEYYLAFELVGSVRPRSYTLSEGASIPLARRPKAFKLYASEEASGTWVEIDSRSGIVWQNGQDEVKTFEIDQTKMAAGTYYRAFKLVFTEPSGESTYAFFLGELDMDIEGTFDPNGYFITDVMDMVRKSGVESPFTVTTTGEFEDSNSQQLFDGDLTVDCTLDSDKNGRALFYITETPTITISFNPSAFGESLVFLGEYGFRMGTDNAGNGWNLANRLPSEWTVHVSDKAEPTDEDWVLVDSKSGVKFSSYYSAGGYCRADFPIDMQFIPIRHVRFTFTATTGDDEKLQLGEICMSGILFPIVSEERGVRLFKTSPVSVSPDCTATASVTIVQNRLEIDPYDLFVEYGTGDEVVTNWLERATRFVGTRETVISGLRFLSDYWLRFGAVATNGEVTLGSIVPFRSPHDAMATRLPAGFLEVEYLESTDGGCQYVDCGFAPANHILGFDLDFIGYNDFKNGKTEWQGNKDTDYGVYLSSADKGQNAQLLLSSSTGNSDGFPRGLFVYGGGAKHGNLTRNERTLVKLGEGKYMTICGSETNSISINRAPITGPNVFVFASGNGAGYFPDQFSVMRIYSLKIYNDAVSPRELVHDFVPAKNVTDDAYGLYDLVTDNWCPNGSATPFVVGQTILGDSLILDSVSCVGHQITATLTREGSAATDVYAACGSTYGGIDTASWQHTQLCGSFAENAKTAQFTTPALARDTVYVRFYTGDGKWSETIYLPDQPSKGNGLVICVR
jgi:hypothetical protein